MRTRTVAVEQAGRMLDAYLMRAGIAVESARGTARLLALWQNNAESRLLWAQLAAMEADLAAMLAAYRARRGP